MSQNRIVYLEDMITQHDHRYYTQSKPTIPDGEYDALVVELRDLYAGNIPEWSVLFKPGKTLPMPGRVEKMHDRPMISLRTEVLTSRHPIDMLHKRVLEVNPNPEYVAEYKYDGLAMSLKVKDGRIYSALLRGDGEKGEDVWDTARYLGNVTGYIDDKTVEEVRGEVVMLRHRFQACNKYREEIGKIPYVNMRNAVSGIIRTVQTGKLDLWARSLPDRISEGMVFIPYSVFRKIGSKPTTQSEDLAFLREAFYSMYCHAYIQPTIYHTPEDLYAAYKALEEKRLKIPFDIDGMVYKVNDPETRRRMGSTGREPNWAIAHKYKAEEAETKLLEIDIQVGPSGRLTPVARLEPVFVGGVTVTNVTLSNAFQVRKKGVRVGDMVTVRRAGDVIPEITGVAGGWVREKYVPNFRIPCKCPECGAPVVRQKGMINSDCTNWNCPAQVKGRLTEAFARDCLDVEGIGPGVISNLVDFLDVRTVPEVLDLTEDELHRAGIGDADSKSIADGLADLKENAIPIDRAIRAFGIPLVGESASRKLAPYIDGWEKGQIDFHLDKVSINENVADNIEVALQKFQTEMCGIMERLKTIRPPSGEGGPLSGKTIAMSGGHPTIGRSELKDMLTQRGAKLVGAPNKTSIFLIGSGYSSDKLERAKKVGADIRSLIEFINDL